MRITRLLRCVQISGGLARIQADREKGHQITKLREGETAERRCSNM
jgi:hypothetical protein